MTAAHGFFALLATSFLYGATAIFMRELAPEFSGYQQVVYRNLFAALLLLPFAAHFVVLRNQPRKTQLLILIPSVLYPIVLTLFTYGVLLGTIAGTIFGLYLSSVITGTLLGRVLFGEQLVGRTLLGMSIAVLGLIIHSAPPVTGEPIGIGVLLGIIGGALQASANTVRKIVSTKELRIPMIALQSWLSVPIIGFLVVVNEQAIVPTAPISLWGWVVAYAAMQVVFVYLLLVGFEYYPVNLGHVVLATELIFGALIGIGLYGEMPTVYQWVGMVLIFAAIVLIYGCKQQGESKCSTS